MFKNLHELQRPDQVSNNEYVVNKKDGTSMPILTHSFAVFNKDKITGYHGVISDISHQ